MLVTLHNRFWLLSDARCPLVMRPSDQITSCWSLQVMVAPKLRRRLQHRQGEQMVSSRIEHG